MNRVVIVGASARRPNTEWPADSGLAVHNGLVCDEYRAAAPDMYGVGDVARWHNPLFGTDMRIKHHDEALVLESDFAARELLVVYRTGDCLTGMLAACAPGAPLSRPAPCGAPHLPPHSFRRIS